MRLMDWNIEWMNNWFTTGSQPGWRDSNKGIADVRALAQRVANVIAAVDPDVLTLQEGPSDPREMGLFLRDFLSDPSDLPRYDSFGGIDGKQQKIYILTKRNGAFTNPRLAGDADSRAFYEDWLADVNGDEVLEPYGFTRDPVIVDGELAGSGDIVRIVSLHTKSKFVNGQQQLWNDPARRQEFIHMALENRRRISAEAMHTRDYLDLLYDADPQTCIVATGDLNDGPGMDYFERHYLTHGVADILMGSVYHAERRFSHPLVENVPPAELFTARFDDFIDGVTDRPLLLDHVLVSPALAGRCANVRVAHDEYEAQEDTTRPGDARDRWPSDHRPVVLEIT